MNTKQKVIGFLLAIVALLGGGYTATNLGSVSLGNEYHATSTQNGTIPNYSVLATGQGALAQVTITSAGSANTVWRLYDATSTVTNGLWATTSLASFAGNATVGTYIFDVIFQKGLLIECSNACNVIGSTTIMWR